MIYNILDYGAVSDGKTLCTSAIQSAIDECNKNGGGRVLIPSGNFYSGTFYLKDNVELHLEHGALLIASADIDDYNDDDAYPQNWGSDAEEWRGKHLIIALECNNVAITGLGKIDGNGDSYRAAPVPAPSYAYGWMFGYSFVKDKEKKRPGQLICFIECKDVYIDGVTIKNAPCWCIFLHGCEYVRVTRIQVFNGKTDLNTDGIDIDCCRFVTVSDCNIETGDDAITFRCSSTTLKNKKPCEFITVTNCNLAVSASAFRIGVGTGYLRHVRVSNITIARAGNALHFMTSYQGKGESHIEDVSFTNISADKVSSPIKMEGQTAEIRNVVVDNMKTNCIAAIRIIPTENCVVSNVQLRNIDMYVKKEEREITEQHLLKRGNHMVEINGADDVLLENVSVFAEDDVLPLWKSKYSEENSTNVIRRNCNF